MLENDILQIAMRYIHIVSAIVAVGGITFAIVCLTPAVKLLEDTHREGVVKFAEGRFTRVLWVAIAGLVVSGTYNWILLADVYKEMGPKGNALIGTKVLLAVIIFAIVFGRSINLIGGRARMWHMINVHLAAIVILLAAILRHFRLEHIAGG